MDTIICDCGHKSTPSECTTGYGKNDKGQTMCFACCAQGTLQFMREHDKIDLYLVKRSDGYYVTDWPSGVEFGPVNVKKGFHNIAGSRYDTWIGFEGYYWHGVQYGEWTQICHLKKTKERFSSSGQSWRLKVISPVV